MLNLVTTLCLLEAGLILGLVLKIMEWKREDRLAKQDPVGEAVELFTFCRDCPYDGEHDVCEICTLEWAKNFEANYGSEERR